MAAILGEGAVDELVIDAQLMATEATGVGFTSKGVVLREDEELFELGDLRLLGDHRDNAGKRRLELGAAVALMHNAEDKEFPIAGTRSSKELHESVALGPRNFLSYHAEWLRLSGVSGRSSSAHVHRNLCEVLRLLHSCSLAAGETLCRWVIQTELAVERSPSMPDYSGLDIVAGTATLPDGRASTSKFNEWVSARLKERASIWKQERLFRQERKTRGGKGKDDIDDDSEDDGPGDSRKKANKKKKKGGKGKGGEDGASGSHGAGQNK
ncbi:unnamed protein product [Effrenium voratum]|uniref:Uncharacterized protein n=1 Tax=Effrenium voratum TaxID=2562239 RepID=A0AA36N0E9_9DINO|nr:unnamed protein product [Effrenium voratum]